MNENSNIVSRPQPVEIDDPLTNIGSRLRKLWRWKPRRFSRAMKGLFVTARAFSADAARVVWQQRGAYLAGAGGRYAIHVGGDHGTADRDHRAASAGSCRGKHTKTVGEIAGDVRVFHRHRNWRCSSGRIRAYAITLIFDGHALTDIDVDAD